MLQWTSKVWWSDVKLYYFIMITAKYCKCVQWYPNNWPPDFELAGYLSKSDNETRKTLLQYTMSQLSLYYCIYKLHMVNLICPRPHETASINFKKLMVRYKNIFYYHNNGKLLQNWNPIMGRRISDNETWKTPLQYPAGWTVIWVLLYLQVAHGESNLPKATQEWFLDFKN